ncbi:MAG TPA: hypothetical protein VNJ04_18400 [Gemmatimonadaceae bacterium]|nr:hypothetical protein [Gemmatimonadaceae bacterium]
MAFPKQPAPVPTDIGRMEIWFGTDSAASTEIARAHVEFDAIAADGTFAGRRIHELLPQLTAAQKTTLFNFLTTLRAKAKAEAI